MCGFWHTQHFILFFLGQYYHFGTKARAQAQPSPSQARPSAQGQAWDFSSLSPLKPSPSLAQHITRRKCLTSDSFDHGQNFGISFSIISIITGIPSLFHYGFVSVHHLIL